MTRPYAGPRLFLVKWPIRNVAVSVGWSVGVQSEERRWCPGARKLTTMGEIEGTYRVLQTPGARLGTQRTTGISTLEPGQTLSMTFSSPAKATNQDSCSSILLLDGTVLSVEVGPKTTGQTLLSRAFTHLNVVETDYFGIEFQTAQSQWVWLEPLKCVNKQLRKPKNAKIRLAVKFFPPDPGQLQEEYTRYLFAMQIKRDLVEERLVCSDNTTALLVSLLLQSEVGDYDPKVDQEHLRSTQYLQRQYSLEQRILECHRQHIGMSPADADFQILEISRRLELYGTRFHLASDREGAKINLSVSHMGVLVFQGNTKINTFNWSKIRKLSFKRRRFLIKLHPEVHGPYQDALEFLLPSRDMCKRFWKICVEYHSFFRLQDQPKPKSKPVLLSRGSSFRYSGRTQKQLIEYIRDTSIKRPPCERRHSKPRVSPCTVVPDSPKQIIAFTESVKTPISPSSFILSPQSFFNPPPSPLPKTTTRNENISASPRQEEPGRGALENAGSSVHSPLQGLYPNPSFQNEQDQGEILGTENVQQGCHLSPVMLRPPSSSSQPGRSPLMSPTLSDSGSARADDVEDTSDNKFSDMLLYTRKGLSCTNQFRVHGRLPLHGMLLMVLDPPAEDSHSAVPHCFTIYSAQTTIGVAASTQVDMRRWLDDLNAAISRAPRYSELSALSLQQPVLQVPGQNHHPNTLSHVCWYRNQSVSLTDHITMMENQLSGYLLRKFKNSNGWQRLWVIFTNFCLYFYKTHQEDAPLASLPLLGYTVSIPSFSDPVTCRHVFKLHFKSHVYFFRADSDYTWRRWMEVIRRGVSSPGKIGHLTEDGIIGDLTP
ncbi:FERM, ARHGEF and pleckstrin domain-containing protein 2 isoform X6 [Ranitomeya variabilis]|uniref:FERM, ARHGEF and pleckstrin domain-containing protein 2 isoform X6 n=1 Tax=Ranitomeya variabilis TaxID=490064 RepID=UPI004055A64A